jgi:tetratricopeptide (TPR) repeat protein
VLRFFQQFVAIKPSVLLLMSMMLTACGSNEPKTLASLAYKPELEKKEEQQQPVVETLTYAQVREEYRQLLDLFAEKELKEKIERRIADVHMMQSVHEQNTVSNKSDYYAEAKAAYLNILKKYPNSPENAEVLYQLSKAYDIEGEQEKALAMLTELTTKYPTYSNSSEAYFRKGDIHFSNQSYPQAEQAYLTVINSNNQNLGLNAHYMLGWSRYKQFKYRESIDSFAYVLNQLLLDTENIDSLGKAEKPLVNDSISSIGLALDKIGGAEAISGIASLAKRPYVWMIYDNIGTYYLDKELYEESASAFRLYVSNYPNAVKAPDLHVKMINTYIAGGFSKQALVEKENYVTNYGLGASYTSYHNGIRPDILSHLKVYLDELATYSYAKGQSLQKEIAELEKTIDQIQDKSDYFALYAGMVSSFDKAADFYTRFAQTFSSDERIDEIYFLKAEALFSAYHYPEAIENYERVAYRPQGFSAKQHIENAGYAAIISYEKYIDLLTTGVSYPGKTLAKTFSAESKEVKQTQALAVESMLVFATTFYTDSRSPAVLANAAEYLFGLNQYQRAIEVSSRLIETNAELDRELKKTAYGIIAHSYFKLEDYQNAEDNYFNQRQLADQKSEEYRLITERLAASVYKKSEVLIAAAEEASAIEQLLRIKQLAPQSPIRITAQYDAASLLLKAARWPEAIAELNELSALYPNHELATEFPRKLAFAYEKNADWNNAALTYLLLVNQDPDADIRREALFLAATMYKKDLNYDASIDYFTRYVSAYPQPFDNVMEAQYHLALNYEKINARLGQHQWLTRIIDTDQAAGVQRTDRSRWLAAWANAIYGDYYADEFTKVTLLPPIVKTIPEKNKWLQSASSHYEKAASYGIFEFVTMSSYKIGSLYRRFADELRSAPTPQGLSESDQAVYVTIIGEQAAPFDQLARDLQQANIERAWNSQFNEWIDKSFLEMAALRPERFNKAELIVSYGDGIR